MPFFGMASACLLVYILTENQTNGNLTKKYKTCESITLKLLFPFFCRLTNGCGSIPYGLFFAGDQVVFFRFSFVFFTQKKVSNRVTSCNLFQPSAAANIHCGTMKSSIFYAAKSWEKIEQIFHFENKKIHFSQ